jgi:hypothetical protein
MKENPMGKCELYRQGDVGIVRVARLPKGAKAKPRENGRIVLAYGEVTGHAHAITAEVATEYELGGDVYVKADGELEVRHEEHGAITLSPGIYKILHQREYTPEAIRNVAD